MVTLESRGERQSGLRKRGIRRSVDGALVNEKSAIEERQTRVVCDKKLEGEFLRPTSFRRCQKKNILSGCQITL